MNISRTPWAAMAALLATVALTVACGGVDSGGTGLTAQASSEGRVSGFGSIFVNGVRFDDAHAIVSDDEGVVHPNTDLKLGMVVTVDGEVQGSSGNGVASRIQYGNQIAGPIESIDLANSSLVVLGQTVRIDADTVVGGYATGLASALVGDLVEVFAFYDPASTSYMATRIDRVMALTSYELRGRIASLSSTGFAIGGALIDYSGIAPGMLPTLANGLAVRVSLQTVPVGGRWVASSVHTSQRHFPDAYETSLEGFVSAFTSRANFQVSGISVDASAPGLRVSHGSINQLANGARIAVTGEMVNGVLIASAIDYKRGGDTEFALIGGIESVNAAAQTFVLRGVTVAYGASTVFAAGRASDLIVGAQVDVRGSPSAGGTVLLAQKVKFQ